MATNKKLMLWCGSAPNQRALANKIHREFGLAAIFIDERVSAQPLTKKKITLSKIIDRLRFRSIHRAWFSMLGHYRAQYPEWPEVPLYRFASINSEEAYRKAVEQHPDLVIVSGTSLVREPLLSVPASIGIINLHTGLSPYVKGGPNCTNWCIANGTWELVGNTIMWINAGIDTGNIITTEAIDVRDADSLNEVHLRIMEHAHDLYLRAIRYLLNSAPPHPSVPQSELGKGQLFLNKMWDAKARAGLLRNWKGRAKALPRPTPRTIPLPGNGN